MAEISGKRITFKRARPNPLFQKWLEELHEEANAKKSKLEPMLKEALSSISKYPLPLESGAECAILSGFDKNLCTFLDKRLTIYKINCSDESNKVSNEESSTHNENDVVEPENPMPAPQNGHNLNNERTQNNEEYNGLQNIKKSKTKSYKPAYRSGGYAILIALLEYSKANGDKLINKKNLIDIAQKYSEESFTTPKPESFYTAWSNMSRLVTKGLVEKSGTKLPGFFLTEQGLLIATELLEESKNKVSTNDIIFNNIINEHNENNIDMEEPHCSTSNGHTNVNGKHAQISDKIEMEAGSYDIILLIDKNETSGSSKKNDPTVVQFQKYPDLKHEYRSLKVGDFTWIARHKVNKEQEFVLPYVVERKRMDDLGASIKDGRFHEQKFRLRKCGLNNVVYMVESYGSNKHVGLPMLSLMQALANTRVQDGFKVHMTDSLTNSARFLAMLTKRLTFKYKNFSLRGHNQEPTEDTLMTFEFFNKSSIKNKPLTVTGTFIKLLLQLKGVSVEKALAITSIYKTPSSLIKAFENCNKKEGEMLLANLKYNDSRNVGPTVSKSIYQLFTFTDV